MGSEVQGRVVMVIVEAILTTAANSGSILGLGAMAATVGDVPASAEMPGVVSSPGAAASLVKTMLHRRICATCWEPSLAIAPQREG
uniref:Uncharacterized protein n=1 Tax=Sphaerodactylus townsendi TaxID=933632 RepID=A0ACB8GD39_9SAUR